MGWYAQAIVQRTDANLGHRRTLGRATDWNLYPTRRRQHFSCKFMRSISKSRVCSSKPDLGLSYTCRAAISSHAPAGSIATC